MHKNCKNGRKGFIVELLPTIETDRISSTLFLLNDCTCGKLEFLQIMKESIISYIAISDAEMQEAALSKQMKKKPRDADMKFWA